MTPASKILTVTYGTFSCTLEGFEDPLSTMKVVAQYFRELSAQDRYFGGTPATPDAAFLHRLASVETDQPVLATVQDNGNVLLRAAPARVQSNEIQNNSERPAPAPVYEAVATETRAESVAAKLMRIRAAATGGVAPEPAPYADTPAPAPDMRTSFLDDARSDWKLGLSDGFLVDTDESLDGDFDMDAEDTVPDHPIAFSDADDAILADAIRSAMALDDDMPLPAPAAPPRAEPVRTTRPAVDRDVAPSGGDDMPPVASVMSAMDKLRQAKDRLIYPRKPQPDPSVADGAAPTGSGPEPTPADTLRNLTEDNDDAAISRLIAQTNSEMDVPEQRARWSAIAHLKAAVATTVADRIARGGEDLPDDGTEDKYRDELSRLVDAPGDAHSPDRPAPFVLISEQRIDRMDPKMDDTAPPVVRARRSGASGLAVNEAPLILTATEYDLSEETDEDEDDTGDVSVFFDPHDFSEFALRLGAETMSDMIEAAGVYAALIECRPHFSPMHLIRQIISSDELGGFDREEGLRAFGVLMRAGKIERVRRGQYIVTDDSDYMTEAKRILG